MTETVHFGFRHVALRVADARKAADFYAEALGMTVLLEQDDGHSMIMTTPGRRDVLTLSEIDVASEIDTLEHRRMVPGTIDHVGFEVGDNDQMAQTVTACLDAGASLIGEVEMMPGYPSAFIRDPDGNVLQVYGFSEDLRARFPM